MSISFKKVIHVVIFISMLAAVLILPDVSFADCLDPEASFSPEECACKSGVDEVISPEILEQHKRENRSLKAGEKITIPLMVIVVGLKDIHYENDYDWSKSMFGENDSIRDFYLDMSYEKLDFAPVTETCHYGGTNTNYYDKTNDGIIHVTVDREHRDWSLETDENQTELTRVLAEALDEACSYVSLADYDDNEDGKLTNDELAVAFIVAGYDYGVEQSNRKHSASMYLRSHKYWFSVAIKKYKIKDLSVPQIKEHGVSYTIDPYVVAPEKIEVKKSGTVVEEQERYGSLAHELGHHLGFPDLYDTSSATSSERHWSKYAVQHMSLMANGSWGRDADGEYRPTALDPWCRQVYGWLEPQKITSQGTYTVTAQNYAKSSRKIMNKVYRIDMPYNGEYYLIESRYTDKWDGGLFKNHYPLNNTQNQSGGIVIWHIDEKAIYDGLDKNLNFFYDINNPEHRPAIMPLYPEKDSSGNYTVIGTAPEKGKPFFDSYLWDNEYSAIGGNIDLPCYTDLDITSKPDERVYSGSRIRILSNAGRSMDFNYIPDSHTQHTWVREYTGMDGGEVPASICKSGGQYLMKRRCKICGYESPVTMQHEAGTHFRVRHIYGIESTCEKDGRIEHWWCTTCGKRCLDPEMTQELTDEEIIIPGGHQYVAVFTQPPTYDNDGIIEYDCKICHTGYWGSIPQLDHKDKPGDDGTSCGHFAAIQKADKAIRSSSSEKDMPGSKFRPITLTSSKQGKRSIKLSWKFTEDYMNNQADYYYVYGAKCGKSKFKKLKTVYDTSVTISKIGSKKLSPKTYYRFIVVAVHGGSEEVLSTSKTIHVATKGSSSKANYTGVYVSSKIVKKAAKMKAGQTISLKAKARKKSGTKVVPHVKLRYESGDSSIASVTSKGVIKAKAGGDCKVYVFTQNGKYKVINITVDWE